MLIESLSCFPFCSHDHPGVVEYCCASDGPVVFSRLFSFFLPSSRCDTLAPVDPNALVVVTPELSEREEVAQFFEGEAKRMFANDIPRDGVCAFVAGTGAHVDQVEVTVTSILEFLPGVRVAIAAEADAVDAYRG